MLQKVELVRKFVVERNGKKITVKDPNPNMTLDEVRKFLAITYPDILNCAIGTPEIKNEVLIYNFKSAVAVKG